MEALPNGVSVNYFHRGEQRSALVRLADYKNADRNTFTVANQWTVIENSEKRPDVVIFLNGLPVVVIELKSPSREETDASAAFRQIRNYMREIPSLFAYNAFLAISDLALSKAGTITADEDRYMEWKTKDGCYADTRYARFDTFFEGIFRKEEVISELVKIAEDMANAHKEGEAMGLTEEEMAFYDALTRPEAVKDFTIMTNSWPSPGN